MRKLALILASAALAAASSTTLAGERVDHLQPQESALDILPRNDVPAIVHTVFKEAWGRGVVARMLQVSGGLALFRTDMVLLEKRDDTYSIVQLRIPHMIYEYSSLWKPPRPSRLDPADYRDLKPDRCEVRIPMSLGAKIVSGWHSVLMETRYYERTPHPPQDGGWVQFSMPYNDQTLAGEISSAVEDNSKPALLWEMARTMGEYCTSQTAKNRTQLEQAVEHLYGRVHGREPK